MAEAATARRRGHGEDSIYFDATKNRYVGAVSVGWGPDGKRLRRKVRGKTKQEVRDKLRALHRELSDGVRSPGRYSLRQAVEDWLRDGLDGRSERTSRLYEGLLEPVLDQLGSKQLREVSAGDIRAALGQLTSRYSTRSLQITRNALERAIRHAEANDLVGRNVAALVQPPRGRAGRPSKSFTVDQAKALLAAAEGTRWHAYVALSLLSGIRTEEARALRWDHVVRWIGDSGGGSRSPRPGSTAMAARRTGTPSMSGGRSGTEGTPRPVSHGGHWHYHAGALTHYGIIASSRLRTGCGRDSSGTITGWSSHRRLGHR